MDIFLNLERRIESVNDHTVPANLHHSMWPELRDRENSTGLVGTIAIVGLCNPCVLPWIITC